MEPKPVVVLIVEDNPADAGLIVQSLDSRFETFSWRWVDLLENALLVVRSDPPDVVLLDLSLPDSIGTGGCRQMHAAAPTVPIVVITGMDDEEIALQSLKEGAQDFLAKDQIDNRVLVRSLRHAIERQRIETALQCAHDELEDRVAARTIELRNANDELKSAIRERELAERLARARHQELAHLSRLNTLGEMASSLAHELNQPLTAIVAYTNSCLRRMGDDGWEDLEVRHELETEMKKAAAQAKRGANIIRRLRSLVSKRESERHPFCVNDSAKEIADLVVADLRNVDVRLILTLDPQLPLVSADRVQIEQVLLNLLRNSIESMASSGGQLTVGTGLGLNQTVEVVVSDTGCGAQTDKLEQLFEPYYTTKADGLGLGLAISRSIVESHRGKLSVVANHHAGLTFRFALPIDPEELNTGRQLTESQEES